MPKFANLEKNVELFFQEQIQFPNIPDLQTEFGALPNALQLAIEKMPKISPEMKFEKNFIFLLPGLVFADLAYIFLSKQLIKYPVLASNKTNNVFFLTAALKKGIDLENLLDENIFKSNAIQNLKAQLAELDKKESDPIKRLGKSVEIQEEIKKIKMHKTDLNLRDSQGLHIAQYAALAGNFDTLQTILKNHVARSSITVADQDAIMACAVASKSHECVRLIEGAFAVQHKVIDTNPLPVSAEIFSTKNDTELYQFIKQFSQCKTHKDAKPLTVVAYYYSIEVEAAKCFEMVERLNKLELSPLMLETNYDIDLVIKTQNEFVEQFKSGPVNDESIPFSLDKAINNNDIGKVHSILHRNLHLKNDRVQLVKWICSLDKPIVIKYLINSNWIDIQFLIANNLLHHACQVGGKAVVEYFLEDLKLSEARCDNNGKTPLEYAFDFDVAKMMHNPVIPFLLNRVNILFPTRISLQKKLDQFEFEEKAVRILFAKPSNELGVYLLGMQGLIKQTAPLAGVNFNKTNVSLRLEILSKLTLCLKELTSSSNSEDLKDLLYRMLVAVESALMKDQSALSEEQVKQFADHKAKFGEQLTNLLKTIVNPFSERIDRINAYEKLELAAQYGFFGAVAAFEKAQISEANRLIQLILNKEDDVRPPILDLESLAEKGVEPAKKFVNQRNDQLAIQYRKDAETKNDKKYEAQLRELAKTHPYAQVQLAMLLLDRYRAAMKSWNPLTLISNKDLPKEALELLRAKSVAQIPDALYLRGVCEFEGLGMTASPKTGLDLYFHAAKNGCALAAETLKSLDKTKNDTDLSEIRCRASIYNAILAYDSANNYCKFEELANKYESLFFTCIADILQSQGPQYNPIQFLQIVLKYVKTTEQRNLIESVFSSIFKKYNLVDSRTENEFIEMVQKLDPILCAKYALVFVHNTQILSGIKRVWVVAAEMKWIAAFGDKPCVELNNLQNCLKDEAAHDISQIKELFKLPESKVVATPVITLPTAPELTLRERLEIADPFAEVPDRFKDPIHLEIMTDPGSADDGRIYDRCTFNLFKDKYSPIKEGIKLTRFTPLDEIRTDAIEFVQAAERRKNEKPATSSATSSTSISAATNSGVTFYEKPTVPIAKNVEQKPADLPSTPIDEVDVAVLQVATDELVVPQAAPPGQMELA